MISSTNSDVADVAADTAARSAVQVVTPWEDTLREYLDAEFKDGTTDAEVGEMCLGMAAFGIETPEQVAALTAAIYEANPHAIVSIDEEGGDVSRLHQHDGFLSVRAAPCAD